MVKETKLTEKQMPEMIDSESLRVLLVEDNPDHVLLVKASFGNSAKWDLTTASTIKDAINELMENNFHVVLTDYRLPDGLGVDLIDDLKEVCPLILMTSQGNEKVAVDALKRGAYDYVTKGPSLYEVIPSVLFKTIEAFRAKQEIIKLRSLLNEENARLVEANNKLREFDKVKSEFLETASHELRTPLTIIREYISLMKDGLAGPISDEQVEYLDASLSNCDRLTSLINDMLDLQTIESGMIKLRRRKVEIDNLLHQCHNDFVAQFKSKKQLLTLNIGDDLPYILCDKDRTIQIIVNLVGNAHKFTPGNGVVEIRASYSNEFVTISIIDSGPGLTEDEISRIFDRFTQLDKERGADSNGTGLGLSIVKHLVELQDGNIVVESVPGSGCKFSFTLPVYEEKNELYAFVQDRISVCSDTAENLHLGIFRLNERTSDNFSSASHNNMQLLRKIEDTILQCLRNKDDETLILESESQVAFLVATGSYDSKSVSNRIARVLQDILDINYTEFATIHVSTKESITDLLKQVTERFIPIKNNMLERGILIVDDDKKFLDVIVNMLRTFDFDLNIQTTDNGYDACILFGQLKPDLVILDLNMPKMNGPEFMERLKLSNNGENTKILICSGDRNAIDKIKKSRDIDVLPKPFEIENLKNKISSMLFDQPRNTHREELETATI